MNTSTLRKKFDFIPDSVYKNLDEKIRDQLLMFRRRSHNLKQKEDKISNLKKTIKLEQSKLVEMRSDLIDLHRQIQHLRDDFYFTLSVTSYKKKNNRYYNLNINRTGLDNKSVSLGRSDTIKEILIKYYSTFVKVNKDKVIQEIKDDFVSFLKVDGNNGHLYEKIMKIIMKSKTTNLDIDRNSLFPISE